MMNDAPTFKDLIARADGSLVLNQRCLFHSRWGLVFAYSYGVITLINGWADEWCSTLFFVMLVWTGVLIVMNHYSYRRHKRSAVALISLRQSLVGMEKAPPDSIAMEHYYDQAQAALDNVTSRSKKHEK